MSGLHFEKLSTLPPQQAICCKHRLLDFHLDDRVCSDWFWKTEASAALCYGIGMPPTVIKNKASLLKLYHCKLLGDERLMLVSERRISGDAVNVRRCDLPANRDCLWRGFKSPGQISHAHFRLPNASELKLDQLLRSVEPKLLLQTDPHVGLHYDYDGQDSACATSHSERFLQMNCHLDDRVWYCKPKAAGVLSSGIDMPFLCSGIGMPLKMDKCSGRYSRTSYRCQAPANSCSVGFGLIHSLHDSKLHYVVMAHKRCYSTSEKQTSEVPLPKSPPKEWLAPVFEESVMRQAMLPNSFFLPNYALQVKTVPGMIPEVCSDESTFFLNYDPYEYVKARPLFERKVIHGSKCKVSGDQPFIWLPYDHTLQLFQSLPLLARFYHEESVCLPRLSLKDLVITGNGTFRLRGSAIQFRECTPENMQDVYNNIRTLLRELMVASVGPDILKKIPDELDSLFLLMSTGRIEDEYLICYHSFYIPLSNKCTALLRIIDRMIENPDATFTQRCLQCMLSTGVDWQPIARSNEYLEQWLNFRTYSFNRRQFILYLRAIIVHKLEHKLPDKFVDFLLYATFQTVLMNLQKTLWALDELRNFHLEELYLHNSARTGFVSHKDVSLIVKDGDGAVTEDDFPFGCKMLDEMLQEEMWPEDKRKYRLLEHRVQQKSLLSKLRLISGGIALGKFLDNDMLTRFACGDDTSVSGIGDDTSVSDIGDFSDMTGPDS
ncbi:unnamed protein product [Urochloa humidicola]